MQQSSTDCYVIVMLSVVMLAQVILIKKQNGYRLPRGKHENINADEIQSVDKDNEFPEENFQTQNIYSSRQNVIK